MKATFPFPLIGMVHLLPLPGAPLFRGSMQEVCNSAVADALTLERAGFDAVLIENYGDIPFRKDNVEPVTAAAMTEAVIAVRSAIKKPFGIQVLRNDARTALGIAAATGATFIRVNIHTGAMLTDQGIIEGKADDTLRLRTLLCPDVLILADIHVKHAQPLGDGAIEQAANDTAERGLADALIISGMSTGAPVDEEDLRRVKSITNTPVLVGSGATPESVASLLPMADGVIAGTAIKIGNITDQPVDFEKAQVFVKRARR